MLGIVMYDARIVCLPGADWSLANDVLRTVRHQEGFLCVSARTDVHVGACVSRGHESETEPQPVWTCEINQLSYLYHGECALSTWILTCEASM